MEDAVEFPCPLGDGKFLTIEEIKLELTNIGMFGSRKKTE